MQHWNNQLTDSVSNAPANRIRRHYAITAREVIENRIHLEPKKYGRKKSFCAASLCAKNDCNWRKTSFNSTPNTSGILVDRCSEIPTTDDLDIERNFENENQEIEIETNWRVHHTPVALARTATPTQANGDYEETQEKCSIRRRKEWKLISAKKLWRR